MKLLGGCGLVLLCCSAAFGGDNLWTSGGPFGGEINSFAFDSQNPNVFFATGDTLLRSTNGGSIWESTDLEGSVVRVHRSSGQIFVAGTSIFRSTDHGASWQHISSNRFQHDYLTDLAFDSANPLILYGVGNEKGVFKSTDGGKNWITRNTGLNFQRCGGCYGTPRIQVDPANGNIVYVLLPSRLIYKSTNGGQSWQQIMNGLNFSGTIQALAIDPSNGQVLYVGGDDGIFKTTNGGGQWTDTRCNCSVTDLSVDPRNPKSVYGAALGVERSLDGGATWRRFLLPAPAAYLGSVAAAGNVVLAGPYGIGIYRSTNSATTWSAANNGVIGLNAVYLAGHPLRPNVLFASGSNTLFKTSNGGNSWDLVKSAARLNVGGIQVHPKNPNLIVAASCCCAPVISTNAGVAWQCRNANRFSSDNVAVDPQNVSVLYLISQSDGVAKSTDQGVSIHTINSGLTDTSVTSIAVNPGSTANLLVGTNSGKVFRSANGGSSWQLSSAGLGTAPVISIVYDLKNPNIVYLLTNYQGKGAYKSTNGGQSWVLKNKGLPTGQASLVMDPANSSVLYTGGYGGIFVTTDAAESWSQFDTNGLGPFLVYLPTVSPWDQNLFYAATERGVFGYRRTVVAGGPVIQQLSPGAAKPGTTITINGNGFGATQGNSKVSFGGVDGGTAVSWTDTRIQLRVPSSALTAGVTVNVASRNSNQYRLGVLPASGRISPSSGSTGNTITLAMPPNSISTITGVVIGGTVVVKVGSIPPATITTTAPLGTGAVSVEVISSVLGILNLGTFSYK